MEPPVIEFVGIVVIECSRCKKQKFVVNSENIKNGFKVSCQCGWNHIWEPGLETILNLKERKQWGRGRIPEVPIPNIPTHYDPHGWVSHIGDRRTAAEVVRDNRARIKEINNENREIRRENKQYDQQDAKERKSIEQYCQAMPLETYKSLIADWILNGKKPKVDKQHKSIVSFDDNSKVISDTINALLALGFSEAEAKKKANIAVKDGFKTEEEIIRKILGM